MHRGDPDEDRGNVEKGPFIMRFDKRYDICFGIGEACVCSQVLRKAGLQKLSYPFDWVRSQNPLLCARLIASGFEGFLNKEDLVYRCTNPVNKLGMFDNRRTGFAHLYDFPDGPIDAAVFEKVSEKYARRIARLMESLRGAKKALMVCVVLPETIGREDREFLEAHRTVCGAFPQLELDLLVLRCVAGVDRSAMNLRQIGTGVWECGFDFRDPIWRFDFRKMTQAMLDLGISARDLRTRAEIRAFKKQKRSVRRKGRYARYGAATLGGFLFRRYLLRPVLLVRSALHRRKYGHILSLGVNCETAFRFVRRWGGIESSLFNWGVSGDLPNLVWKLRNLEKIGSGEFGLTDGNLWECAVTGFRLHGRRNMPKGVPLPPQAELDADLADLRGRLEHLKGKFLRQLMDDERTLLVRRLSDNDMADPSLDENLDRLRETIKDLGGRNLDLLIVVTAKYRSRLVEQPGLYVRTVTRFNPKSDAVSLELGDNIGWDAIFSEFVPRDKPNRRHGYKFAR